MHYEHKECKILRNYRKTRMWFNVSKERSFQRVQKKKKIKKEQHETLILKWISNIEFHVDCSIRGEEKLESRKDRGIYIQFILNERGWEGREVSQFWFYDTRIILYGNMRRKYDDSMMMRALSRKFALFAVTWELRQWRLSGIIEIGYVWTCKEYLLKMGFTYSNVYGNNDRIVTETVNV